MNYNNLPSDPIMLMSLINTKLRDFYPDLDALCDDMDIDKTGLTSKLAGAGFNYDKKLNRFI